MERRLCYAMFFSAAENCFSQSLVRICILLACFAGLGFFCNAAYATNPPTLTAGTTTSGSSPSYYTINQKTVVMTADSGAIIYYTLDGSVPTTSSTQYTAGTTGITVNNYTTVNAIADLSSTLSTVTTCYVEYEVPRSNLQLWLKPENMVATSGAVSSWLDVSGNDTLVTQGTSANRPTVVAGSLYGFSGASFNGATTNSSYLSIASGSTLSKFLDTITGGVSVFAVINPANATGKTLFTASSAGVSDLASVQTSGSTVAFNAYAGATAGSITTSGTPLTTGTYQVLDVVYATTPAGTIDVNTVLAPTTGTLQILATIARPVGYIGGNNALTTTAFWGGTLEELLVYSRNVNVTERALVQAYLANRYQLANSIVTPAPVISVPTGTLTSPMNVAIFAPPNAVTHFTVNGTTPTTSSPVYSSPVPINYTQTLQAISVANGVSSTVSSATYTLNSTQWPAPSTSYTTAPTINLQLPTTAIPQ